jgi:hypothetical protein
MAETVDIPQIGRVKTQYVWAAGGVVVIIVGYAYLKRRSAAGADTGPAVDPTSGSLGATGGTPPPITPAQVTSSTVPTNNQEWTQDVLDKMGVVGGTEESHTLSVIGKYLNKIPLTADEADVIRQAWALAGKPPQGPDNFTLTSTGSTTGTPTGKLPAPTGLFGGSGLFNRVNGRLVNNYIDVNWNPVDGATSYHVEEKSAFGAQSHDVTTPGLHETGLMAPNADHYITVWAVNAKGERGDPATVVVHTHDNSY